jgi:hypothetical protein
VRGGRIACRRQLVAGPLVRFWSAGPPQGGRISGRADGFLLATWLAVQVALPTQRRRFASLSARTCSRPNASMPTTPPCRYWRRASPQAACSAMLCPHGDRAAFRGRGTGSGRRRPGKQKVQPQYPITRRQLRRPPSRLWVPHRLCDLLHQLVRSRQKPLQQRRGV